MTQPFGRKAPRRRSLKDLNLPDVIIPPHQPLEGEYLLKNGLRHVRPYMYTYTTYCKMRWIGREILEIFQCEFRDRDPAYYRECMANGNILLNGRPVSPNHILKNGDVISHTIHRHETAVSSQPVGIVHEDEHLVVINKPAGVPVHPAGRYRYNSVIEIMRAERGHSFNPSPCNRLDRLTSGVMFIAKHPKAAGGISTQIKERSVKKEYVARVVGKFPDGQVVCEKPILQISPKLGLNQVRANGKSAKTVFKRLAYYPRNTKPGASSSEPTQEVYRAKYLQGYSVVQCLPITGRTHQIRVHLQYLGHPIANDPIYSNQRVFGPDLAAGLEKGDDDDSIIDRLARMGKEEVAEAVAYHDEMVDEYEKQRAERLTGERCDVCNTPLYSDPGVHELGIYLHARRYAAQDGSWDYQAPLPEWALPPDAVRERRMRGQGDGEGVTELRNEVVCEPVEDDVERELSQRVAALAV